MKIVLLHVFIIICLPFGYAQNKNNSALNRDSIRQEAEALLIRLGQEKQLDSIVKAKLSREIEQSGSHSKIKQMEAFVQQINLRDSLRKRAQLEKIEELKEHAQGYPVAPFSDTLFFVYMAIGPFDAEVRANELIKHINSLYLDPFYTDDSLVVAETENGYDIIYKSNVVIFSVTTLDALWLGEDIQTIANSYLLKIKSEIISHKNEYGLYNQLKRISLVIATLIGLALTIKGINRLFRTITFWLTKHGARHITSLKIRKANLLSAKQYRILVFKLSKILRVLLTLLSIYFSLLIIFSIFPQTKKWTGTLLHWVIDPVRSIIHSFIMYLPKLFTILVIYIIFRYVLKLIRYVVEGIEKGNIHLNGFHPEWARPTFSIVKFLLYAFMLVLVFPYLPGSDSAAFQGISVFIGVLFSLGSSSAISNMIAGLIITYMRPFKIGDRIKIGESVGDVIEKNILVTRIRTIKNEEITVPNATVLSNNTVNYSTNTKPEDTGLILYTTVTISYDVPQGKVHQLLIDAALKTNGVLQYPKPFVLQTGFNEFNVSYQINAYTKKANQQDNIYSQLNQHIQHCFNEAGIEIMSPNYMVYRKDELNAQTDDEGTIKK